MQLNSLRIAERGKKMLAPEGGVLKYLNRHSGMNQKVTVWFLPRTTYASDETNLESNSNVFSIF